MENPKTGLTPSQSADILIWYNDAENKKFIENGWKKKIAIGLSAMHACARDESHWVTPDGPLLTRNEASDAVIYLDTAKEVQSDSLINDNVPRQRDIKELAYKD